MNTTTGEANIWQQGERESQKGFVREKEQLLFFGVNNLAIPIGSGGKGPACPGGYSRGLSLIPFLHPSLPFICHPQSYRRGWGMGMEVTARDGKIWYIR